MGKKIAELCSARNITKVSFDRGGRIYTGRVAVSKYAHCTKGRWCDQQPHITNMKCRVDGVHRFTALKAIPCKRDGSWYAHAYRSNEGKHV